MKIVHCIFSFCVGGAETMLIDIVNRQSLDHDVSLLIVNDKYDESLISSVSDRVRIIRLNRSEGSFPVTIMIRLNYLLRRMAPDVIHIHDYKLLGLIRGLDRKIFFTVHDVGLQLRYVRPSQRLIAISEAVRTDILDRNICQERKLRQISNGIRVEDIVVRPTTAILGPEIRIVNIGRLNHLKKGQHILIEAVSNLRKKGYDISVDFIGDGESREFLAELSRKLEIGDSVRFLGNKSRDYIYARLSDYDLMCHPSLFEGFGLTVAEGIVAGLPVVVSAGDGPFEIISRGKYGSYFEKGDTIGCADAIRAVIDDYPAALGRAEKAREHVLNNYSIDSMVRRYVEYYRD